MAVGKSRRIVIDVDDVDLKRSLHAALAQDGQSMKEWFVAAASSYLHGRERRAQLELPIPRAAETASTYEAAQPSEKP